MNAKQENKLSMYLAVQKVCSDNNGVWSGLPSFSSAFTDFKNNLTDLNSVLASQEKNITGVTLEKDALQNAMVDKALIISKAAYAYAEKENLKPLQEKVNYSVSDLKYGRDTVRIQRCQVIHDEANSVVSDLADYGVTALDLKKLQNAIDDYGKAIAAPRTALTEQKGATAQMAKLFDIIDRLLKRRLDKLIENFKIDEPEFYKLFFDARMVIGYGGRFTILKGIVKNGKVETPVIGAKVEFILNDGEVNEKATVTETNKAGEFIFENVPTGEQKLRISKEGLETVEFEKLIVERGRVNEINVKMKQAEA